MRFARTLDVQMLWKNLLIKKCAEKYAQGTTVIHKNWIIFQVIYSIKTALYKLINNPQLLLSITILFKNIKVGRPKYAHRDKKRPVS